ncbi:MAG TPA: dTMP kinase [Acidimicrobiia bacterium]|jgi:dTMP kinase|nr:dTMP kinase [Acidimicrobiia bacterium]
MCLTELGSAVKHHPPRYVSLLLVTVLEVSKYVVVEGVDGSGKTTIATALVAALDRRGTPAILVREPGGTPVGEVVRTLLLDSENLDDWAEVFLFAAQRAELAREVIQPALDAGTWVVSDRSYYSSIAYQGRARELGEDRVRMINETGLDGVLPDHVFVLDVDPSVALDRQDTPDRIGKEGIGFQTAVQDAYLDLAKNEEKVVMLDGDLTVEEMVSRILEVTG